MALHIQEHLSNGGSIEDLERDFALKVHHHPELPLVGFSYHQLDSPKTHPIVRESRGILLEKDTWKVVAKAFNRFFNLGEIAEEYKTFNWSNFDCYHKADGSLMLFYNYADQWHVKTRGSFADGQVQYPLPDYSPSFSQLFWKILETYVGLEHGKINTKIFDPKYTYVFEMCSLFNKVVRTYREPSLFLLSIVNNETTKELSHDESDSFAEQHGLPRVERHHFSSLEEIQTYILHLEETDPTNEGVIVCDDKWLRYKIKTLTYTALHHMLDNGNLYNPKRLLVWALKEDPSELLLAYPEVQPYYEGVSQKLTEAYDQLLRTWNNTHFIKDQKNFALAIKGKTPFAGLLFQLRKQTGVATDKGFVPGKQTESQLKELWRNSAESIAKVLF